MINPNRLFLVPALSSILILIPVAGLLLWLSICLIWYSHNKNDVNAYIQGRNYRQNETSKENLEELK